MLANVIAALSLLLSLCLGVFYLRDRRQSRFSFEREHVRDLLQWHSEIVEILIRLRSAVRQQADAPREADLVRLSAKIECGRFFFPNLDKGDGFGAEKPPAYRGYRNLALDFLVASYNLFCSADAARHLRQAESLQRHFTALIFEVVQPRTRLQRMRSLTDQYFVREESFEDFLRTGDGAIIEHIWRPPQRSGQQ